MQKKTLQPNVKQAFQQAGVQLTPEQEHVAASATNIDWANLLKTLGQIAAQVLPVILALLGGQTPKQQAQAQAGVACCNHHQCCCDTLKAILHAADICSKHMCACCCE